MCEEHGKESFPVQFEVSTRYKHGERGCRVKMTSTDTFSEGVHYEECHSINEGVVFTEIPDHC